MYVLGAIWTSTGALRPWPSGLEIVVQVSFSSSGSYSSYSSYAGIDLLNHLRPRLSATT